MKRELIIILVIAFAICGCSTKQKQKPYMLTMFVMKYDNNGNLFYLERNREPILASDDTTAFNQAIKLFYLDRVNEMKLDAKHFEKTVRFELKDGLRNVNADLTQKVVDSLHLDYQRLNPKVLTALHSS